MAEGLGMLGRLTLEEVWDDVSGKYLRSCHVLLRCLKPAGVLNSSDVGSTRLGAGARERAWKWPTYVLASATALAQSFGVPSGGGPNN
jgi:hypothetical protein